MYNLVSKQSCFVKVKGISLPKLITSVVRGSNRTLSVKMLSFGTSYHCICSEVSYILIPSMIDIDYHIAIQCYITRIYKALKNNLHYPKKDYRYQPRLFT